VQEPTLATHQLRVTHTWDGQQAAPGEIAELTLRFTPTHLHVAVEAGYHCDPPPPGAPSSHDGLWRHEVVELFVAAATTINSRPNYTEIELSPHGHWLGLRFAGWRQRLGDPLTLHYRAEIDGPRWHGRASLERHLLPPPPYLVGAFAIHGEGVGRRFLTAAPSLGNGPDFHRAESLLPLSRPPRPTLE